MENYFMKNKQKEGNSRKTKAFMKKAYAGGWKLNFSINYLIIGACMRERGSVCLKKGFVSSPSHIPMSYQSQSHISTHTAISRHDTIFIQQIKKLKVVKTSFMRHKDVGMGTLLSVDEALIKFSTNLTRLRCEKLNSN